MLCGTLAFVVAAALLPAACGDDAVEPTATPRSVTTLPSGMTAGTSSGPVSAAFQMNFVGQATR